MAPSRSERGRRTRFNRDQIRLPLVENKRKLVSKIYDHEVVVTLDDEGIKRRYLQIKIINGGALPLIPLKIEEDSEARWSSELARLEGRVN